MRKIVIKNVNLEAEKEIDMNDGFLWVSFFDDNGNRFDIDFTVNENNIGIAVSGQTRLSIEPRAANMIYIKSMER